MVIEAEYARVRQQLELAVARICPAWLARNRDDIIQVALARLLDRAARGEGNDPLPSSYIWKTAYSVTVDYIRRDRRAGEVTLDEVDSSASFIDRTAGPEQRAGGRQIGVAIRACLQAIARPRRLAVVLHLQGHNVPEASRLLGWDAKRVENLVYRGLADLRACLDSKGLRP
jgi:RNA polymerase sigma-70 factor (ECF subfamily)